MALRNPKENESTLPSLKLRPRPLSVGHRVERENRARSSKGGEWTEPLPRSPDAVRLVLPEELWKLPTPAFIERRRRPRCAVLVHDRRSIGVGVWQPCQAFVAVDVDDGGGSGRNAAVLHFAHCLPLGVLTLATTQDFPVASERPGCSRRRRWDEGRGSANAARLAVLTVSSTAPPPWDQKSITPSA